MKDETCALCSRLQDRRDLRVLHVPIPPPPESPPGPPAATAYLLLCPDCAERLAQQATRAAILRGLEPQRSSPPDQTGAEP